MKNTSAQVAVIGLWHLGCTVAACLAKVGYKVTGFDFDKRLIEALKKSELPIKEAGLSELTKEMQSLGKLDFTSDESKLSEAKYIVIAYDTPVDNNDIPDLTIVKKAVKAIAQHAGQDVTIIVMSQVPAQTSRGIYLELKKKIKEVEVVYNPENLRLSQAIETYLDADRQILGVSSKIAETRIKEFYSFYKKPLMFMSLESAELVKHGINCFLAMSVSFINQLSDLSEKIGADITEVIKGMKSDSRIGQKAFLSPGLGFAGGTLGRDLRILENLGKKYKVSLPLIKNVYEINQKRKENLFKKLRIVLKSLKGKKIALLGLVYKPGTNTLRRSLSLEVGKWLHKQKTEVFGFDPALIAPKDVLPIKLCKDPYAAASGVDILIIITEWPEFKSLDFARIKKLMKGKIIFDTKNILTKNDLENLGFKYYGTGIG